MVIFREECARAREYVYGESMNPEECLMGESMNRRNALWGKYEPEECLMGKHESGGMSYGGSMNRRHMP